MADIDNKPQAPAVAPTGQPAAGAPTAAPQPTTQADRGLASQAERGPASHGNAGQQPRPCPKDCSRCSLQHQVYCATKMTFDSFAVMNVIIQRLDRQQQTIDALSERLAAIQTAEAEFAAPQPVEQDLFAETAK